MPPDLVDSSRVGAPYEVDDDLDLAGRGAIHGREQVEQVEALGDMSGDRVSPRLPPLAWRPDHAGTTRETRASTSASGRGGQPGTYVDTGITRSTPFVTE